MIRLPVITLIIQHLKNLKQSNAYKKYMKSKKVSISRAIDNMSTPFY